MGEGRGGEGRGGEYARGRGIWEREGDTRPIGKGNSLKRTII